MIRVLLFQQRPRLGQTVAFEGQRWIVTEADGDCARFSKLNGGTKEQVRTPGVSTVELYTVKNTRKLARMEKRVRVVPAEVVR